MIPHPILKSFKILIIYVASWIIFLFSTMIIYYYKVYPNWEASAINSLLLSTFLAILGIAIWYPVLYSFPEKVGLFNTILNHIVSATILITLEIFLLLSINKLLFATSVVSFLIERIPKIIIFNITLYVGFVLAYYIHIYRINLQEKKKEEARLTQMVKEAELNLLKSQINPHFLFNSLNSISALTLTDPTKAQKMIILLSDFLRYSISRNNRQLTTLEQEMENIERYLEIEKIRFGERIQYYSQIAPLANKCLLPTMILQPLFENAVKHGVSESTTPINIYFTASIENNILTIKIINNFDPNAVGRKGTGMGLKNIQERLQLIFHNEGLLKYKKENNTFEVTLLIPQ